MLNSLRSHPALAAPETTETLVTTYFDTPGGALRQGEAALRVRQSGTTREQTLKLAPSSGTALRRSEWNEPVPGDLPEVDCFPAKAREVLARLAQNEPLLANGTATIARTSRTVRWRGSTIAVAFDEGTIAGGGKCEPVCELELELVDGRIVDAIDLALNLPLGPDLQWSIRSKAERCQALTRPGKPAAVRAGSAKLTPAMDGAAGFQMIAWSCLEQLLANYPLVIADGAPEAVHQSRVGLRRLRVAMKLFGSLTDDESAPILRAELKAAANGLGLARDIFVLTRRVKASARLHELDVVELLAHLDGLQAAATRAAQEVLASEPFQRLLFQMAAWIEGGDWLTDAGQPGVDQSLGDRAAKALSRLRRKLRSRRDKLAKMSDTARHLVRIDVKRLRYAMDFLAPLWGENKSHKRASEFASTLAKLQDNLGRLNDMAVAMRENDTLFVGVEPITAARLSAQLSELFEPNRTSRRRLLHVAQAALERACDEPAWWKSG